MTTDLILVANAHHARLYSRASEREPLQPLAGVHEPDAHLGTSELGPDRPGHGSSDRRRGGVTFEPRIDPRRKRRQEFARRVACRVDEALTADAGARLSVFACCPFLGELKGALSPAARKLLRAAIDVDLTHFEDGELAQRVEHELHTIEGQ